jgi:hypothetical protein
MRASYLRHDMCLLWCYIRWTKHQTWGYLSGNKNRLHNRSLYWDTEGHASACGTERKKKIVWTQIRHAFPYFKFNSLSISHRLSNCGLRNSLIRFTKFSNFIKYSFDKIANRLRFNKGLFGRCSCNRHIPIKINLLDFSLLNPNTSRVLIIVGRLNLCTILGDGNIIKSDPLWLLANICRFTFTSLTYSPL